jgi:hypothetical protein
MGEAVAEVVGEAVVGAAVDVALGSVGLGREARGAVGTWPTSAAHPAASRIDSAVHR